MHRRRRPTQIPPGPRGAVRSRRSSPASPRSWLRRYEPPRGDERGDVPGWVLITVMTAGLVSALWLIADDQLAVLFERALASVTGP